MAEPVKMHKDGEEFIATSPTQVNQMAKLGWVRGELPVEPKPVEPVEPVETVKPVKPKRGRPKKSS